MNISVDLIKQLREETQAPVADCRTVLEEANGDIKKARELLVKKGFEKAEKKVGRATKQGVIDAYIHQNARVGTMVELLCETDFVARTSEFKTLARELAMQITAMEPNDVKSLLKQEYIRDSSKTVSDLLKETIAKLGENIAVARFDRFEIG